MAARPHSTNRLRHTTTKENASCPKPQVRMFQGWRQALQTPAWLVRFQPGLLILDNTPGMERVAL